MVMVSLLLLLSLLLLFCFFVFQLPVTSYAATAVAAHDSRTFVACPSVAMLNACDVGVILNERFSTDFMCAIVLKCVS